MPNHAVPTFSGGPAENGSDWLDALESHFMDVEWEDDDPKRCRYFRLHLRGEAKRRYNELPETTRDNWDALHAKWTEMYPPSITVSHEQSHLQEFRSLRLDASKLAKPMSKEDGSVTWETIKFVERLRHCASGISILTDNAKGIDAYANLPSVIKDQLPKYPGLGPSLSDLAQDLLSLNHYEVASRVQQNLSIQDQLNSISQSLARTGIPRSQIPVHAYTSNTPSAYPTRYNAQCAPLARLPLNDQRRPTFPLDRSPMLPTSMPPNPQATRHTPLPTSFPATSEGRRQYDEAIRTWDAQYGQDATPTVETRYPLTPGSLSAGSGECWRCGLRHQGHLRGSPECLKYQALPQKEQAYRSTVEKGMRNVVRSVRTVAANHIEASRFSDFMRIHSPPAGAADQDTTDLFFADGFDYYDEINYDNGDLDQGNGTGDAA